MSNHSIAFQSTPENLELLMEAFFKVEPKEHVKAWNWYQLTKHNDARMDAVNEAVKVLSTRGEICYNNKY